MGADKFILTTDENFAEPFALEFDVVLSTVDDVAGIDLPTFVSMVNINGHFHSVGLPDKEIPAFKFQALAGNGCCISVSHIGSKKEAVEMLNLAVKKGVKTWAQVLSMKDAGKGIEGVKTNKVRYRYVLKQDIDP